MADSSALRSRRSRAHAAGDCSLCRHGPPARLAVVPPGAAAAHPGDDAAVDPRTSLEGLARRLEDAHKADPGNSLLARELRMTLQALAGDDDDTGFDVG